MKTTRRHELQTNDLADSLARWIEQAKPYSRAALAVVVLAAAAIFVWGYMSAQGGRRTAEGWQEYFDAVTVHSRDPLEALSAVSDNYGGTPAGKWSRLVLADLQLENGTDRLLIERKDALVMLKQAAEKYQSILHDSRDSTMLQRAHYGLARAREALGTLPEALEEYRAISKLFPDGPFAEVAEQRAEDLERGSTKEFYDWLAKYEPPHAMSREPGKPGVKPSFLDDALDDKGIKLPSVIDDKSPATITNEPGAVDLPEQTAPGTEAVPLDEKSADKPASDKPASDKPASDGADADKPAADAPAEKTEPKADDKPSQPESDKP